MPVNSILKGTISKVTKLKAAEIYHTWKEEAQHTLVLGKLWKITDEREKEPVPAVIAAESADDDATPTAESADDDFDIKHDAWKDKNDETVAILFFTVDLGPREHIRKITKATEL